MRRIVQSERGTAIITAIALMTVMSGVALAAYSVVDTQQTEVRRERHREGSFTFGEAAMNNQAFLLSRRWPGSTSSRYPACTQGNAAANPQSCPSPTQLATAYTGPDFGNVQWSTTILDDKGSPPSSFYDPNAYYTTSGALKPACGATVSNTCVDHWDRNGNDAVWVRAHGEVAPGRPRTLVALVRIQESSETLPRRTVIAGRFRTDNAGNKTIVNTNSTAASPHPVTVRCDPNSSGCMEYEPNKGQISPDGAVAGPEYVGQPAIQPDITERLIERAASDGTYFASGTCPTTLTGRVVYIDNATGCNFPPGTGNVTYNSFDEPGIIIIRRGQFTSQGGMTLHGIIYHLNADNSSDFLIKLRGNNTIYGALFIDGPGGIDVGSAKFNLIYDDRIFQDISSYGTASIVQNSWRELKAE